ncbi:MAG: thymidylate synthase [Gammaproteobacteria bacterium]
MTKHYVGTPRPLIVDQPNLSAAWAEAFLYVIDNAGTEIAPLVLSVTGFDNDGIPQEDQVVRQALDALLTAKDKRNVEDVAYTIFPQRLWKMAGGNRARLFELYAMAFPRYRAMNRQVNGRGLYFERLVGFGRGPSNGNQLEWILSQYEARSYVRRSMLQAAIFDPARDHVANAQLGFPCLQQVSFEPTSVGLVTNAFYATQQLFMKAYGNYLGLARLGAFVAHEMGMPLARLNVMVGVAKLERITKSDPALKPLLSAAQSLLRPKRVNGEPIATSTRHPEVAA